MANGYVSDGNSSIRRRGAASRSPTFGSRTNVGPGNAAERRLLVFDQVGVLTCITLIIVEAAITMGLSLWILRGQRERSGPAGDLQRRVDQSN